MATFGMRCGFGHDNIRRRHLADGNILLMEAFRISHGIANGRDSRPGHDGIFFCKIQRVHTIGRFDHAHILSVGFKIAASSLQAHTIE